jgi:hypothetical protein
MCPPPDAQPGAQSTPIVSAMRAPVGVVQVRIPAQPGLVPVVRLVASDLAGRAGLDIDAASDLRMAVDEACVMLIGLASGASPLQNTFLISPNRVEVALSVHTTGPESIDITGRELADLAGPHRRQQRPTRRRPEQRRRHLGCDGDSIHQIPDGWVPAESHPPANRGARNTGPPTSESVVGWLRA